MEASAVKKNLNIFKYSYIEQVIYFFVVNKELGVNLVVSH